MKPSKAALRAAYKLPKGRIQINAHGCDRYSIEVFRGGKCVWTRGQMTWADIYTPTAEK